MPHFNCLTSILVSCLLLDPLTDEGKPCKHEANVIKAIYSENYCCFFVYDSGDRINWILGSPYKLIRLAE